MTLEEAIAAAEERARVRCAGCQVDAAVDAKLAGTVRHLRMHETQHTCHGDLAAVKDVALAAVQGFAEHVAGCTGHDDPEGCLEWWRAEIERLFGETPKENTMTTPASDSEVRST